jgi:flagellar basal-body rod modification protein FlgD
MTDLSAVTSSMTKAATTTKSTTAAAAEQASLDYDAFLQLMIAQLKNQDPTNPMDSAEYMAQLATFTQVEQSIMMNSKLDSLLTASSLEQANTLIGRTVTSADGKTSGEVTSVKITSEGPLASLKGGGTLLIGEGVSIS